MRGIPVVAALAALLAAPGSGQGIVVKLGTRAPDGSTWHLLLKEMAEKWREASGGQVTLRIYPSGVAGDEPDMVRAMRIGRLHASALSVVGMSLITPEPQALSAPLLIRDNHELDYVRDRLAPAIEAKLKEKGFVVLNWGDAGWVQFFTTREAATPEALRGLKLFVWTGDPATLDIWKDLGFKPVPLSSTDILPSLQTGLIEAVPTTPLIAESAQLFGVARHMTRVNWSPLVGCTLVSQSKWEEIPGELRPKLLALAREIGERLKSEVRKLEGASIEAMRKRGLAVHEVDEKGRAEWRALAERGYPRVRGEVVPAATFDQVKALAEERRAATKAALEKPATP